MRHILSLISMVCAAFLGASAALADGYGGSLKDGPAPVAEGCVSGKFAGRYVGVTIGYANHDDDKRDLQLIGNNFGDDDSSVAGGVFWGFNVQCGRFVAGIESDFNLTDTETSQLDPLIGAPCAPGCIPSTELTSSIEWFSTSRIRMGFVHNDSWLIYATAGVAYAEVEHSVSDPVLFPSPFNESHSDKEWGWTVGGGVEMLRDNGWALRAEALFIDLGDQGESYDATAAGCIGTCTTSYDWEDEFWVARLGLSYRFGAREEVAAPLK
ncbi:MAG: outer membrane protein [Hyphomicrobium sp.]